MAASCLSDTVELDVWAACETGDLASVQSSVAQINLLDWNLSTPLHYASGAGHAAVVEFLLQNGANVDASNIDQVTPLHKASVGGHLRCVQLLLAHKADPTVPDGAGLTPLHFASWLGRTEIVQELLKYVAQPNILTKEARNPLNYAAAAGHVDIVRLFIPKLDMFETKDEFGFTPLMRAAERGHLGVVKELVEAGADLSAKTFFGKTALQIAISKRQVEIVNYLSSVSRAHHNQPHLPSEQSALMEPFLLKAVSAFEDHMTVTIKGSLQNMVQEIADQSSRLQQYIKHFSKQMSHEVDDPIAQFTSLINNEFQQPLVLQKATDGELDALVLSLKRFTSAVSSELNDRNQDRPSKRSLDDLVDLDLTSEPNPKFQK